MLLFHFVHNSSFLAIVAVSSGSVPGIVSVPD